MRVNLRTLETPTEPTPYVSIKDAAKILDRSEDTLRRQIRDGKGAEWGGSQIGNTYRVNRAVLDRYVNGGQQPAPIVIDDAVASQIEAIVATAAAQIRAVITDALNGKRRAA